MAPDHDHVGLEVQELHSATAYAVHIVGGPPLIELHIAACGPAESCQLFPQPYERTFDIVRRLWDMASEFQRAASAPPAAYAQQAAKQPRRRQEA